MMESKKVRKSGGFGPQPISPVIDKVIGKLGLKKRYYGWQIVHKWPEIVGEEIADAAKAERFADGILFVRVKDAVWRQELSMQIESIMQEIHRSQYGKYVKQIRLA